jgi:hypothetical protein
MVLINRLTNYRIDSGQHGGEAEILREGDPVLKKA